MLKAAGVLLLALPFVGVWIASQREIGFWPTVACFATTAGVAAVIAAGAYLVTI